MFDQRLLMDTPPLVDAEADTDGPNVVTGQGAYGW